jgi:hypothetical protein
MFTTRKKWRRNMAAADDRAVKMVPRSADDRQIDPESGITVRDYTLFRPRVYAGSGQRG